MKFSKSESFQKLTQKLNPLSRNDDEEKLIAEFFKTKIHISFHEDTVKSEIDFTKSERKTRSKHTKENFDENVSPKVKKRHYVAYPADDGVDTVDGKDERAIRALRKNALKERNTASSTESVEPAVDSRKSVRSTRRTRKFDENSQDIPSVLPQDAEPTEIDPPKPKKGKKKKKRANQDVEETLEAVEVTVEVKVPKKKSKNKIKRRSGSMVVEDIVQEAPNLNKSNMSIDSFHSAAGSPRNKNDEETVSQINLDTVTAENYSPKNNTRKTRSSVKLDNTQEGTVKEPLRRKSSVKVSKYNDDFEENENQVDTPTREQRKRKSSIKETAVSENTEESKNSTFEVEKSDTSRKTSRNDTFDKTPTKNDCIAKEEGTSSSRKSKRKSIANENATIEENPIEDILNTTFEKDSIELGPKGKKRKSSIQVLEKPSPIRNIIKRNSVINGTVENDMEDWNQINIDATFNTESQLADEKTKLINITFEKDLNTSQPLNEKKKSIVDMTFDVTSSPFKSANEISSPMTNDDLKGRSINTTYEKDNTELHESVNTDKDTETKINSTFENDIVDIKNKRKSLLRLSSQKIDALYSTFNVDQEKKLDTTFDKNSKSSLISSDNSMITLDKSDVSRISITSDESKEENILNTTPVLIESSMDESVMNTTKTPIKNTTPKETPITPLKREGTFTKDEPEVTMPSKTSLTRTPTKRMSLPSPGFTPFHVKSSSKEKRVLNVTRSIEKRRSSLAESRTTKVMFCSPVNNPAVVTQNRRKVIKSNLKGSNKSFVFDESVSLDSRPANRKRSYTQSDAEDARVKRKRLADGLQQSVDRLSRPRTSSASAKLAEPTTPSKKPITPKKSEAKLSRTKLPNFAALHQKQFSKMESLDECQERKARRAKQLLTPTGAVNMLDRISPKDKANEAEKPKEAPEKPKEDPIKPETPIKSLPTFKSLNPGYTRFGFKLNLDVNPFSISSKTQPKPKENKPNGLTRQPTLPSLTGATSIRREVAKQTVMREKSFTDRRSVKRTENNRTVIKGVRTNRRFELQMRMRDI